MELLKKYAPDIMLVQEIHLTDDDNASFFSAHFVSKMGYGTAIGSELPLENIKKVQSPYAEMGGFIRKKTTIASTTTMSMPIQFVSFHGYNGQPFKNVDKLVAHVEAVLEKVDPVSACFFAGDFNTWTTEHLEAVKATMQQESFELVYSWPYPGRDEALDHVFVRGINVIKAENYACASDHRGAILEIEQA
ncbi:MAG: hypothetical protein SGARI_006528 [Bacillariaceae sp.]